MQESMHTTSIIKIKLDDRLVSRGDALYLQRLFFSLGQYHLHLNVTSL